MPYKTLKHKGLQGVYGVMMPYKGHTEIGHSNIPDLLSSEATIDNIKKLYKTDALLIYQLNSYELIDVDIVPVEEPSIY